MKLGVYVGSFNPVHNGHIKIIKHLLKNYIDKIIIIPTDSYWNKNNLANIEDRINMLKLYENGNIIIDTQNNNIEYTYQIMSNLKLTYSNDTLYLVLGADNIINFDKWINYKELLKYNLIIINRNKINVTFYLNKLKKKDRYIICNEIPIIDISSTEIRNKLKNKDYNLKKVIDKKVLDYIKNNNLYS